MSGLVMYRFHKYFTAWFDIVSDKLRGVPPHPHPIEPMSPGMMTPMTGRHANKKAAATKKQRR